MGLNPAGCWALFSSSIFFYFPSPVECPWSGPSRRCISNCVLWKQFKKWIPFVSPQAARLGRNRLNKLRFWKKFLFFRKRKVLCTRCFSRSSGRSCWAPDTRSPWLCWRTWWLSSTRLRSSCACSPSSVWQIRFEPTRGWQRSPRCPFVLSVAHLTHEERLL